MYTQEYIDNLALQVRKCILEGMINKIPFVCGLCRESYEKYNMKDILRFLPWGSVGIIEDHKEDDIYLHSVHSLEIGNKIIDEGVLKVSYSNENNHIGSAIYSYPLYSGRIYPLPYVIMFTTNQKHIHIVEYDDGNAVLGETDFLEDVKLKNAKLLTYQEALEIVKSKFSLTNEKAKHYYGITESVENIAYDALPEYINKLKS